MSIEKFEQIFSPDRQQLRDTLTRQRDRETALRARSLVAILALNLAKEGGNELRIASQKLKSTDTTTRYTVEDFLRMPEEIKKGIFDSLAQIACGVAIVSIEDTIGNKSFSYELVASLHNQMTSGTPTFSLRAGEMKEEEIHDSKWRLMMDLAGKDKTLTSFLQSENIHLMPNGLAKLIEGMYILPAIRRDVIPSFKKRALLVID